MKKLLAIMAGVALIGGMAQADLLVQFTFTQDDPDEFTADFVADNLSASAFNTSDDDIVPQAFGTWGGSGTPYAGSIGGWGEESFAESKHFFFDIEADSGWTFDITNVVFRYGVTAAGPSEGALGISTEAGTTGAMVPGSQADIDAASTQADLEAWMPNPDYSAYTGLDESRVSIHGWDGGTGHFRLNDVEVYGTVVPEPGTMALLVLGMVGIAAARRKMLA